LVTAGREKAVVGFKVAFTEAASANPRKFLRNLFGSLTQFELNTIPVSIAVITDLIP
jgi:hypothetical protein